MSVKAIADSVFGEGITGYVVFDNAGDTKIDVPNPDEDSLLLSMPDMQLDMSDDDGCYAVASDEYPLDAAHWIARKGDKVFGVYILDEPVDADSVPEDCTWTIPVGVGWTYEGQDADLTTLAALIDSRVSGGEEVDDDIEDVVHEVPVSDVAVDAGSGEPETVEEDSEEVIPK